MNTKERDAFLQSRQRGIGGSDIGSMLSNVITVEYGCERNLWARLSGVPEDNPERASEPQILGTILEPYIRRAYEDQTGRRVEQAGLTKHPSITSLQYHDDGVIYPAVGDTRTTRGVLEVKGIGRDMMRKVNEQGLCIDYVLQVQAGIANLDTQWGAFAVAVREDIMPLVVIEQAAILAGESSPVLPRQLRIEHFEVERNPDITGLIEDYAPKFWATVGNHAQAPKRMEPEDPRCSRCVRKNWCQGAAIMESVEPEAEIPKRTDLDPLIEEYKINVGLLEQCEELVTATERKIKDALGGTQAVKVQVGEDWKNIIYRLRNGARRVDGRSMAVAYDSLRRLVIQAGLPGSELVPGSGHFFRQGGPSRPLLLAGVLPKKDKGVGELDEEEE